MPSNDARWIVGTMVVFGFALVAQINGLNGRMDRLDARMDRIEDRLEGFDGRLRAVELAFGKVDQRLLTLERAIIPAAPPPPAD